MFTVALGKLCQAATKYREADARTSSGSHVQENEEREGHDQQVYA